MTKRKAKTTKTTSKLPKDGATNVSPGALRALEKSLANFGRASASSPFGLDHAETPLARAQELVYHAWEIPNPAKRISLAKHALEISRDCADAYLLLAEEQQQGPEQSIELFRQAVEAGERAVGPECFEQDVGSFWGLLETRPYMRSRMQLAMAQWEFGERSSAIVHAQDMLRLNPNDNQGVRHVLITWLATERRAAEARDLWKQFEGDSSASWAWSLALMEFVEHGDSTRAKAALRAAITCNRHLAPLLLGREAMPFAEPEFIGIGDRNEAVAYVFENLSLWQATDRALRWLSHAVPANH